MESNIEGKFPQRNCLKKQYGGNVRTKVKVRLGEDDFWYFGPGVSELLKSIDRYGSVAGGALNMNLSYSKAWKMIKDSEKGFGCTLVERSTGGKGGGKAVLTDKAREIILLFDTLSEDVGEYAEKRLKELSEHNGK